MSSLDLSETSYSPVIHCLGFQYGIYPILSSWDVNFDWWMIVFTFQEGLEGFVRSSNVSLAPKYFLLAADLSILLGIPFVLTSFDYLVLVQLQTLVFPQDLLVVVAVVVVVVGIWAKYRDEEEQYGR
jgi:hypothetical protein